MQATNPRDVAYIFRDYTRRLHSKCNPKDPNFIKMSISCGHVSLNLSPTQGSNKADPITSDRNVVRTQLPILRLRPITTRPTSRHRPQRPALIRHRTRRGTRQGAPRASEAREGHRREGQGYPKARGEDDEEGNSLGFDLVYGPFDVRCVGVGVGSFVVCDPEVGS